MFAATAWGIFILRRGFCHIDDRNPAVKYLTASLLCTGTTIDHIPYRHQFDSEIYQGNLENYEAAVKADLNGDDSREQRSFCHGVDRTPYTSTKEARQDNTTRPLQSFTSFRKPATVSRERKCKNPPSDCHRSKINPRTSLHRQLPYCPCQFRVR